MIIESQKKLTFVPLNEVKDSEDLLKKGGTCSLGQSKTDAVSLNEVVV